MTATMPGVDAIRVVWERLIPAVGIEKGRRYRELTIAKVGEHGSGTDWLRALAAVVAADGDPRGQRAFLAALDEIEATK